MMASNLYVSKDDYNGFHFNDHYVAKELVYNILIHLDVHVLKICREVCRQWKFIIDDPLFWKHKIELEGKKWPPLPVNQVFEWSFYANVYLQQPFGRNLIKNCNGKYQLNYWTVASQGGDGFSFEHPPAGSDIVPQEAEEENNIENFCFGTSYHSCSKEQVIDLTLLGIPSKVMDTYKPGIFVKDWYAGRFDCGCVYEARFSLLNAAGQELDAFEYRHSINQWEGREWLKVTHLFENYPDGVRFIKFYHGGMDNQFWAGHYGAKMTGSSVIVQLE